MKKFFKNTAFIVAMMTLSAGWLNAGSGDSRADDPLIDSDTTPIIHVDDPELEPDTETLPDIFIPIITPTGTILILV